MTGLTQKEVEKRILEGKVNKTVEIKKKSYGRIFSDNIFTFFNLINIIVFIMVLWQKSLKDSLFMGVVISNTILGIVDEAMLKRKLDKLSFLKEKKTIVIRDNKKQVINSSDIVIDEVMYLTAGQEIPCDSIILDTGFFEANEALLTGEEDFIKKEIGDTIFAGSYITTGECYARAVKIGEQSFCNGIISEAKKYKKTDSQIVGSIEKIIKIMTIAILPLGFILFASSYFRDGNDMRSSILGVSGSIVGMIPSGLYLITTITASISIMRLIKRRALVSEFSAIEMLSRVTTLCLDKTGTLTTGEMEVDKVIEYEKNSTEILKLICKTFQSKNTTLQAINKKFGSDTRLTAEKSIPFSSERKYLEIQHNSKIYHLGAFDILTKNPEILSEAKEYSSKGKRVLFLSENDAPICLIVISDVLKKSAKEVLEYFEKQDIRLKIISGDNPQAVSVIARQLGFLASGKYVDMSNKNDSEIPKLVSKYSIFGRVKPAQKKLIVKALKNNSQTVAMIGDGVNDVLALKEADLAITMANGAEAAKSVAQVTLIDSDFSPLPSILSEGRRIVNNIESVASLYLTKTIFSVIITIFFILFGINYPLVPVALTIIGSTTIGMPSFFLALFSNDRKVKVNFFKTILTASIPTGCLIGIFVGFLAVLDHFELISSLPSMAFYVTSYFCFIKLIKASQPFNYYKAGIVSVMLFIFLGSLFLPPILEISRVYSGDLLTLGSILLTGTILLAMERQTSNDIS